MNTNSANKIENLVSEFDPIKLEEMDRVRLMRRVDSKYVFSVQKLADVLEEAKPQYFMFEVAGKREQKYETVYFDTSDYKFYNRHHSGKLNRHKVRIRKYVYSNEEYLEVKLKNNRRETIKSRIRLTDEVRKINSQVNSKFLEKHISYSPNDLLPMLGNSFVRLTLVNKNFKERVTLDYNIRFEDLQHDNITDSSGICVAEVKRNRDERNSDFINILSEQRIHTMGFSKYCLGLAMLNSDLKSNLFKQRLRYIEKHASV